MEDPETEYIYVKGKGWIPKPVLKDGSGFCTINECNYWRQSKVTGTCIRTITFYERPPKHKGELVWCAANWRNATESEFINDEIRKAFRQEKHDHYLDNYNPDGSPTGTRYRYFTFTVEDRSL